VLVQYIDELADRDIRIVAVKKIHVYGVCFEAIEALEQFFSYGFRVAIWGVSALRDEHDLLAKIPTLDPGPKDIFCVPVVPCGLETVSAEFEKLIAYRDGEGGILER
jgi:hypothetical protein